MPYQEWWRNWFCEARQPDCLCGGEGAKSCGENPRDEEFYKKFTLEMCKVIFSGVLFCCDLCENGIFDLNKMRLISAML